ncbi:STAS/SEC14 domain-containing protein [Caenimonas koreensis]|uniref:STAS/SEC14 domain-containing protein n=1 Tax=Caenimonas koreensis TaxID=367474 RepID=UPI0037846E69
MHEIAIDTGPSSLPIPSAMHARVARGKDHLEVALTGYVGLPELLELIRRVGMISREHGDRRVLFDLLKLEGDVHVAGQMQLGQQVATCLAHLSHVASVVRTDKITRTSESVARSKGAHMKVFDTREHAIAWLRSGLPSDLRHETEGLDVARAAIWASVRHLFPHHSQAIQLPTGTLAISWAIRSDESSDYEMATPITVRLEPELAERLIAADDAERERMALALESSFREGLIGYDPYTAVPRARVIVLG